MDDDGGLFTIELSSSDESRPTRKVSRDFQSEKDFSQVKADWQPKVERGEILKTLRLPINEPTKGEVQSILHAIEELYFFRRYDNAVRVTREALKGILPDDLRRTLQDYEARLQARINAAPG